MPAVTRRSGAGATATAAAYRSSISESIPSIVGFLVDLLGTKLTANLASVDVSTVSRWRSGRVTPTDESERRLRGAYQTARLLLTVESDHTVRAWFIGMNPQLDDQSPIELIVEGNTKAVLAAARSFVAFA